jgi:23S rRNA pseudouridine1911/1915/1917 synthase
MPDPSASPPDALRSQQVSPEQAGTRLDVFLARWLDVSRAEARSLLSGGKVQLDDRSLGLGDKGQPLASGAEVAVVGFVPPLERRAAPAALDPTGPVPSVLARGADWIAIDKPAGMPVHPYREGETGTVLGFVAGERPEIHGVGEGGLRSGVVHRLDLDTSGVLVMASQQSRWQQLRLAFSQGRAEKIYRAIVVGQLGEERELRLSLRVARHRPARVRVVEAHRSGAREVCMRVSPLEPLAGATLVQVAPTSGFLHQIRAALAHIGHPLIGDRRYGSRGDEALASRHMLHASRLRVEEIEAECAEPEDFRELAASLRNR